MLSILFDMLSVTKSRILHVLTGGAGGVTPTPTLLFRAYDMYFHCAKGCTVPYTCVLSTALSTRTSHSGAEMVVSDIRPPLGHVGGALLSRVRSRIHPLVQPKRAARLLLV